MFRITPQSMTQTTLFHNRGHVNRLGILQQQASSGLKYTRPSENPRETNVIGVQKRSLSYLQLQKSRIEDAKQPLNNSVSQLLDANQLISRARQIGLQATQSFDPSERAALASEVDSIIDRVLEITNSKFDGKFGYAGQARDTRPFELVDDSGLAIKSVRYHGSRQNMETVISDSISVQSAFSGADVFLNRSRGSTLYLGGTGARAGTGTDSFVGRANLLVKHTATAYEAGSGVAVGTDSIDGDTVIGLMGSHKITIRDTSGNGSAGTVSLNNGPEVAWTAADSNLAVAATNGAVVHIDTSTITPGFDGDINLESSGTLSTDGGKTSQSIDFSGNQTVVNSVTGGTVNVDSSGIRLAGKEPVEFTGSADVLTALLELRDDLRNTRGLPESELNKSLERRVGDFDRLGDHLLEKIGQQSVALQDLDQLTTQNDRNRLDVQARLGELEGADFASVIVEMQQLQTTMQFNYAALSILQSNNLLDFLG